MIVILLFFSYLIWSSQEDVPVITNTSSIVIPFEPTSNIGVRIPLITITPIAKKLMRLQYASGGDGLNAIKNLYQIAHQKNPHSLTQTVIELLQKENLYIKDYAYWTDPRIGYLPIYIKARFNKQSDDSLRFDIKPEDVAYDLANDTYVLLRDGTVVSKQECQATLEEIHFTFQIKKPH